LKGAWTDAVTALDVSERGDGHSCGATSKMQGGSVMKTTAKEGTMYATWMRIARGVVMIAALGAPLVGLTQVSLSPYDAIDEMSERNAMSVDVLSTFYVEVSREFQVLQARYQQCQDLTGKEQSLCMADYEKELESALVMIKGQRREVVGAVKTGAEFAVSDKDEYFATPGNMESFITALVNEDPDDPGMMVSEHVLDAIDLYVYTTSFFNEVMRKVSDLRNAHVQKMKIALADIEVPDVPDPGEATERVDKTKKKRWAAMQSRINASVRSKAGPGEAMKMLPGDE
jgi:hypothetical protein